MTCDILATGSKGNAVLLNRSILVDCGVPYKLLSKDPEHIGHLKLVLLTHAHGDHINPVTVKRIHSERPSVRFVCGPWMVSVLLDAGVPARNIDSLELNTWYYYGESLHIKCVPLLHDVPNCGWDLRMNGETVFYATDCGTLQGVDAPCRDLYLVEGNYKEDELKQRIQEKAERNEFSYEWRVEHFHLSEEQALAFLARNAGPSSKYVLIHKHKSRT